MKTTPRLLFLVVAGLCAGSTSAQTVLLFRLDGAVAQNRLGTSVAIAGDLDGDGQADLLAGGPLDHLDPAQRGFVRVVSGANGSVIRTLRGSSTLDFFGAAVASAGDVDGDGRCDVIVGAPFDDPGGASSGSARVFSGADGSLLHTFGGASANDQFGTSVAGAGDVNGDGFDDLVVGAWLADTNGVDSGSAMVYSGATGALLWSVEGASAEDNLGVSVAGAGDVDDDGFADVVIGAHRCDEGGTEAGLVTVHSGVDGTVIWRRAGAAAGAQLGFAVAGVGDVDGDGVADFAAGAPEAAFGDGSVTVWSGATGAVLFTIPGSGGEALGFSVAGAGDVDGDGLDDVVAGAPRESTAGIFAGAVRVYGGPAGSLLRTRYGDSTGDRFGWAVGGGGDLDGDAFDDIAAGARLDDNNIRFDSGSVSAIDLGFTGTPSVERSYGAACLGANGRLPRIGVIGRARVGETFFVTLRGAAPSVPNAVLLVGDPLGIPLDLIGLAGCTLFTTSFAEAQYPTDAAGMIRFEVPVANDPLAIGAGLDFQWVVPDAGAPHVLPLALSDGLRVRIGG